MAQAWPAPKPKLTQEEFDDAVKTNIEDFDMSPEEAVKSAVEEFELQGYDLSSIIKSQGGIDYTTHPVAVASSQLKAACAASSDSGAAGADITTASSSAKLEAALTALRDSLRAFQEQDKQQEAFVVAHKCGAMQSLLTACSVQLTTGPQPENPGEQDKQQGSGQQQQQPAVEGAVPAATTPLLLSALAVLKQLLAWLEIRDAFGKAEGPELMTRLMKSALAPVPVQQQQQQADALQTALAAVAEAACFKAEDTKCRFMDLGFISLVLERLKDPNVPLDFVAPACGTVRSVVTPYDDRPPCSKAFMHAPMLPKSHSAIRVLLGQVRRVAAAQQPEVLTAVLSGVRMLAANEEICREFTDDGGVMACLEVLRSYLSNREVVRACLLALRQLANSDGVKKLLAEADSGIAQLQAVLAAHGECEDVTEAVLGLLANMTLRQPEIVMRLAEAGMVEALVEVMQAHPAWPTATRQACLLLRNMVVRTPELRPAFLERGAEALLRQAKARHPGGCRDVGSAALRDLGLDNYND